MLGRRQAQHALDLCRRDRHAGGAEAAVEQELGDQSTNEWPMITGERSSAPTIASYNLANTMAEDEARAVYDRFHVPGPGRMLFDAAVANFNPRAANKVDFHKADRPPLLIIGNELDHTVPASVCREAAKRLARSKAVVDYQEFAGRPHLAGAPGWEVVADNALDWAADHTGATAPA